VATRIATSRIAALAVLVTCLAFASAARGVSPPDGTAAEPGKTTSLPESPEADHLFGQVGWPAGLNPHVATAHIGLRFPGKVPGDELAQCRRVVL
jgi:hypothetical protein